MPELTDETIQAALGRRHRDDPVVGRTGGPAGNARLTAWTGLVLLVLFLAELVTLLDVHRLISWHIAVGALLVPPALLKTATTGWRILRYYAGDTSYREAGPPPLLLRLLGPLVVVSTLAVLATGIVLVLAGTQSSRRSLVELAGLRIDAITLHQASFVVWGVATGLHVLGRLLPALSATVGAPGSGPPRQVPGRAVRIVLLVAVLATGVVLALTLLPNASDWVGRLDRPPGLR